MLEKQSPHGSRRFARWLSATVAVFCVFILIALFYADGLFTNESTPGGDAKRVISYVQMALNSDSLLPLWEPRVNMGTPMLADPERVFYTLLAPLLSLGGPDYYNLNYNLVFLATLLLHGLVIYWLGRSLGLSLFGASAAAVITTCSGIIFVHYLSGRINTLIYISASMALLPLYKSWHVSKLWTLFFSMAFLTGLMAILFGYYVIHVLGVLFLYAVGVQLAAKQQNFFTITLVAAKQVILVGLTGLGLFAIFLLPLADYQLSNIVMKGWNIPFYSPRQGSLANLFLPLATQGEGEARQWYFPYVSLLILPGLLIYFGISIPSGKKPIYTSLLFMALLSLLVAANFFLPQPVFQELYAKLPLIREIRHSFDFNYNAGIFFVLISVAAIENVRRLSPNYWRMFIAAGLIFLIILLSNMSDVYWSDWSMPFYKGSISKSFFREHWVDFIKYISLCMLFLAFILRFHKYSWMPHAVLIAAVAIQWLAPQWPKGGIWRTENQALWPHLVEIIDTDPGYYRVLCPKGGQCPPVDSNNIFGLNGFSMYFSPQYRKALEILTGNYPEEQRPHWVKGVRCDKFDRSRLEVLNIKYAFCNTKHVPKWNGEVIGQENSERYKRKLTRKTDFEPSLKLFHDWQISARDVNLKPKAIKSAWNSDQIILNSNPGIEPPLPSTHESIIEILSYDPRLVLEVVSSANGILYTPELYDKRWTAVIDGIEQPVLEAYGAFRAIPVKAGKHKIEFVYSYTSWQVGKSISGFSALFFLGLTLLHFKREYRGKNNLNNDTAVP